MSKKLILLMFCVSASGAFAQSVSDSAIEECQSIDAGFTSVKDCLPETDVAITMLRSLASEDYYSFDGLALAAACKDLNETSTATWACAKNAISDAVELLQMVSNPEKISDPRFKELSNPDTFEQLTLLEKSERGRFDQMMWGGSMYHPLK